ncbi:hydrogenase/urease accessory protein HupE [Limimaricola variabilis]|uniref:Hydrogenase/urease accessory protein HupE n=2 Tax=Limimaricola variabilis TaxID=1492771 RepID=A0ABR6HSL6_9RHOB|nr:hydrogenase/urease accessory protein HupE [Limimaricola variabilis]
MSAVHLGFSLILLRVPLPGVEPMILTSTVMPGLVVALALHLGLWNFALLVGVFALFYGHAHVAELGEAAALRFAGGFTLATLSLHLFGVAAGQALFRSSLRSDLIACG